MSIIKLYSIIRQGNRWLVFYGWACCAAFDTKQEALTYINEQKEMAR